MREIKIGLVGAGVIGKKHALAIKNSTNSTLSAIVDVKTDAKEYAKKLKIFTRIINKYTSNIITP